MKIACHSNNSARLHVHFDPQFLKREEERKEEKKVRYCSPSFGRLCFSWLLPHDSKQRPTLPRSVDSYPCYFYPSLVSQKLLKKEDSQKKNRKY